MSNWCSFRFSRRLSSLVWTSRFSFFHFARKKKKRKKKTKHCQRLSANHRLREFFNKRKIIRKWNERNKTKKKKERRKKKVKRHSTPIFLDDQRKRNIVWLPYTYFYDNFIDVKTGWAERSGTIPRSIQSITIRVK